MKEASNSQFKASRVMQEYDFLKNSGAKGDIDQLKRERN